MQDSPKQHHDIAPRTGAIHASKKHRTPEDELLHQRMLDRLRAGEDVRTDLAAHVSRSVKGGGYDNDLKLDIALDRMIEHACDDLSPQRKFGRRATDLPGTNQASSMLC